MFKKFTNGCVALVQKYLPDAYIFAIILTIIAFIGGMAATGQGIVDMTKHWGNGVWSLLAFSMQMVLVLVLGNAFAISKPIKKVLDNISGLAKTPGAAIMIVSFVSGVACWLNWGFGLIVGALLAKEMAKKVKGVDYRLLIAAAYSGFVVWHAGASGSVPLSLASDANEVAKVTMNAVTETIPVARTLFSVPNLAMTWLVILSLPLLNRAMHPTPDKVVAIDPKIIEEEERAAKEKEEREAAFDKSKLTPAEKLENATILSWLVVAACFIYLFVHFKNNGFQLSLNIVNMIFLSLGILFHGTPINYVRAINESAGGAAGILLQFPFYAGIMGIMTGANADGVSLASTITDFFLNIATKNNFPMLTFFSAGLINLLVPSGGGQWAVQGPIAMPASIGLGVDPAITAMAIAWGDAWTNMIQPFWALPALGLAKLGAKDIMGYCVVVLLYVGIIVSVGFYLWAKLATGI
ncbi:MAG: short-chain fatty acid transporter [Tissierellia bacterium]|nr:short-chain fatty acid transporter [Tissierellia bacterium]